MDISKTQSKSQQLSEMHRKISVEANDERKHTKHRHQVDPYCYLLKLRLRRAPSPVRWTAGFSPRARVC